MGFGAMPQLRGMALTAVLSYVFSVLRPPKAGPVRPNSYDMMIRQTLLKALRGLLGDEPGVAVIYSSFAKLMPHKGFTHWDAVYAIEQLAAEGWTIAVPAFTFSFCGGKPFHHAHSASEVGVLADWLLAHASAVKRTPHPIYSFVVTGPRAAEILACPSATTFGDDSPFGFFDRVDAHLIMLGCGWEYATQWHRYEENVAVPYRYFKTFEGQADFGDGQGTHSVTSRMYVRDLAIDPINVIEPVIARLRPKGGIAVTELWRGQVEVMTAGVLAEACLTMLAEDIFAMVADRNRIAYAVTKRDQARKTPALRVAVLGSANVDFLSGALESHLSHLMPERRVEIYESPYGQLRQDLIDPNSALRQFKPDVSIFCDRLEDLTGQTRLDARSLEIAEDLVTGHAELLAAYHAANGGWVIVNRFASVQRHSSENSGIDVIGLLNRMNGVLAARLEGLSQLVWLDVATEAAASNTAVLDERLWYIGRFPYSEPFTRQIALRWSGLVLAMLGKTARLIVLDLDNTMWGGVLGEDGISGVKLGGDFPGNAFAAFQKAIKVLTGRGIALAVCSKNDQDLALQAIENLPDMQLRSADIVAHRINWSPKFGNIREIAEELNLGLESVLFVDDNPVEREAVRRNLPGVKVLDLPADPANYCQALLDTPWLSVAFVTAEDKKRVASYKARKEIEQTRSGAASLEDFYADLQMTLHLQPLDDGNIARAVQLCNKTNQFNTTSRRYDASDLKRIAAGGDDVVVVGLQDRHSERENIGLLILKADGERQGIVDSYLLSCRILGRGIETALLHWAQHRAAERSWTRLVGQIIETERNAPVRSVFRDAGFRMVEPTGEWVARSADAPALPKWLAIQDGMPLSKTEMIYS